jgi:hypothetical protein
VDQANTTQRQVVAGPPATDALTALRQNIFDAGAAAIASGLCETVLITDGERGPLPASGAPAMSSHRRASPATPSLPSAASGGGLGWGGPMGPPTLFTIPVLRYMKTYGLSHEQSRWLIAAVR